MCWSHCLQLVNIGGWAEPFLTKHDHKCETTLDDLPKDRCIPPLLRRFKEVPDARRGQWRVEHQKWLIVFSFHPLFTFQFAMAKLGTVQLFWWLHLTQCQKSQILMGKLSINDGFSTPSFVCQSVLAWGKRYGSWTTQLAPVAFSTTLSNINSINQLNHEFSMGG